MGGNEYSSQMKGYRVMMRWLRLCIAFFHLPDIEELARAGSFSKTEWFFPGEFILPALLQSEGAEN